MLCPAHAGPDILRFGEVRAGMRGTGRTVFEGTTISTFEVEIVGTLPDIGPGRNLILARLAGGPLARTGVLSGMSGSPVTIDGKLVGAVALTWGFATEPIAGITPIEEMLAVADVEGGRRAAAGSFAPDLARLSDPERAHAFLVGRAGSMLLAGSPVQPAIPLSVSGIEPGAFERLWPGVGRAGFLPVQAGAAGRSAAAPPPIEPGSAMAVKLVRGDVEVAATGTVTWIEGNRVLALGHPLFGLGAIDLPLAGATVETLLPSVMQSVRIARPLGEVGALRQDRAAGVAGLLGAQPHMIPVRLLLRSDSEPDAAFSFDVADHPLLGPLLLYASTSGILATKQRAVGSATVRLGQGSIIKLADREDVDLANVFAGPTAFEFGTGVTAYILYLLMNNSWSEPRVGGVNLVVEYTDDLRTARVHRASVDRHRVAPGDDIEVTVVLRPYRGPDRPLVRTIHIPEDARPGTLRVEIGGALAITRYEEAPDEPVHPRDLDHLIRLVNQLRRNDRVYILVTGDDTGALVDGSRMPNLPPSATSILSRPHRRDGVTFLSRRALIEEELRTEWAVSGAASIDIEVAPR